VAFSRFLPSKGKREISIFSWNGASSMELTNLRNFRHYVRRTSQGMTEYIIVVAVIAIGSIAMSMFYGNVLRNQTAAASKALAGRSGDSEMSSARDTAIAASMDAQVGKGMANFADTSTQ
jgi:hypothetical protein